jgi:hypothetical protein
MIDIVDALKSLQPNAEWVLRGETLEWIDNRIPQPTKQQIDAEVTRLQAQYDALEYARKRAPEYPPLTELADALYHQSKGDDTKMTAYLAKCEAVKQKYPKE